MRRGGLSIISGALLLIAAVAAFVIVPEHMPATQTTTVAPVNGYCPGVPGVVQPRDFACPGPTHSVGLSRTTYDIARISTWAVLIVGALLVIVGLLNYSRRAANA
jgi:hypothetical protein